MIDRAALLRDLLVRVESALAPDRDIDYVIEEWDCEFLLRDGYVRRPGDAGWYGATPVASGCESIAPATPYTTSFEAASYLASRLFPSAVVVLTLTPTDAHVSLDLADGRASVQARVCRTTYDDGSGLAMSRATLRAAEEYGGATV